MENKRIGSKGGSARSIGIEVGKMDCGSSGRDKIIAMSNLFRDDLSRNLATASAENTQFRAGLLGSVVRPQTPKDFDSITRRIENRAAGVGTKAGHTFTGITTKNRPNTLVQFAETGSSRSIQHLGFANADHGEGGLAELQKYIKTKREALESPLSKQLPRTTSQFLERRTTENSAKKSIVSRPEYALSTQAVRLHQPIRASEALERMDLEKKIRSFGLGLHHANPKLHIQRGLLVDTKPAPSLGIDKTFLIKVQNLANQKGI